MLISVACSGDYIGWCGCHEILIQCSLIVLFLTRLCHFRLTSSSFFLPAAILQIEEAVHKMVISFKNCRVNPQMHTCMIIYASLCLLHSFTTPFDRPSASLESFHSPRPPHYYSASLHAAVQKTTPEGVLSQCWCHERSEQSRSSHGYMA
jgi:hypothetical protein